MRIRVVFSPNDIVAMPVAQNYFLASTIYSVLSTRPDYARFLHNHGYTHQPSGRNFKLFVFSPLMCAQRRIDGETILLGPGTIQWFISSPKTEFVTILAGGLLSEGKIDVLGTVLPIDRVEAVAEPSFTPYMNFTCLSPVVVTRSGGPSEHAHFCTHEDPDFSERVRANLIRKHELVHGRLPDDSNFEMRFDTNYIIGHAGRVTKLIDIRGTQIRGVMAPFSVSGSTELMRIGYECGFGERGSMGFGCTQVQSEKNICRKSRD